MKLGFRIWLLIFILVVSILLIFGLPPKAFDSGVIVTEIDSNSSLFDQGLRTGQIITSIDGELIKSLEDYSRIISENFIEENNSAFVIGTNVGGYSFYGKKLPNLTVAEIPKTNLKLGLDLAGGQGR